MDVIVKSRHGIEIPEHFRSHVEDKLSRVDRLDSYVSRIEVELSHERNPRQSDACQRVEITCRTRGPVLRAEACAPDFLAAVDVSAGRLEARLRRHAQRRRDRSAPHRRVGLSDVPLADVDPLPNGRLGSPAAASDGDAQGAAAPGAGPAGLVDADPSTPSAATDGDAPAPGLTELDGGLVVREKTHPGEPMSLDQALEAMELVGHDFYLFSCLDSGRPSVVYRRRGYDYGVLRLAEATVP